MADEPTAPGPKTPRKTAYDWFLATVLNTEIEMTDAIEELLLDRAREYVAVTGGLPPWDQWVQLGQATRDAFKEVLGELHVRRTLEGGK